jgi:DNA end-binding protein Ku
MASKRKTRRTGTSKSKHRASWRGQLRFGLVSFEVQALNAHIAETSEIHFHLLHKPDSERIHYAKICPKHGEVPNDEIVEGYEYTKGHYIEIEKDELDALRTDRERSLTIDAFVRAEVIDPIYFDGRMYYLLPSGAAAVEPYAVLAAAMEQKARCGVGQVVFSGREQLALVRPVDGMLTMAMLNYDAEIRKASDLKRDVPKTRLTPKKLKLAEQLVEKWQDAKFDFSDYKDRYRQRVKEAIAAKRKGVDLEPPEEEEPEVINLMDALRRSVEETRGKTPKGDSSRPATSKHRTGAKRSTPKRRRTKKSA